MNLNKNENLERILKDKEVLEKLSKIESKAEMERKLKLYGLKLSSTELENTIEVKNQIESLKLNDSELEEITGGFSFPKKLSAGALSLALGLGCLGTGGNKTFASGPFEGILGVIGQNGSLERQINQTAKKLKDLLARDPKGKETAQEIDRLVEDLEHSSSVAKSLMIAKVEQALMDHGIKYMETSEEVIRALEAIKKDEVNQDNCDMIIDAFRSINPIALGGIDKNSPDKIELTLAALRTGRANLAAGDMSNFSTQFNELEQLLRVIDIESKMLLSLRGEQAARNLFDSLGKWGQRGAYTLGGIIALKNSGDIIDNVKNLVASGENKIKNAVFNFNHKGIDIFSYKVTLQKIEERLKNELVGQDEAIDKIMKIMTGYFESLIQAKESGKKHEGGLLLYLTGLPATGKSTAMRIIEEEMKLGSCTVRMSDIVEDKGNNAKSASSRLLKPVLNDNGKVKVNVDTNFARTIKAGRPTLYCIDEVDKMRVWDATSQGISLRNEANQIMGGSIDEMLRNFGDTGQINGIDASGSILVATSNESSEDLKQLESSLYNRYKYCNVQFKDLTSDDYKEIILRKSKDLKEYYKNKFNVDIEWDKDALDHYSEVYEREKSGGRGVDALINEVRAVLKNFADNVTNKDNGESSDDLEVKNASETWTLHFDNDKNSLTVAS